MVRVEILRNIGEGKLGVLLRIIVFRCRRSGKVGNPIASILKSNV